MDEVDELQKLRIEFWVVGKLLLNAEKYGEAAALNGLPLE
jgi:hypothetical protein